jgi:hypothetical protein
MKLRVEPIYGWGWFDGEIMMEVPMQFDLEVEFIEAGASFASALGHFNQSNHPLSGLWLLLAQRHTPHDGDCNLSAFNQKPNFPQISATLRDKPRITGFVHAETIV